MTKDDAASYVICGVAQNESINKKNFSEKMKSENDADRRQRCTTMAEKIQRISITIFDWIYLRQLLSKSSRSFPGPY